MTATGFCNVVTTTVSAVLLGCLVWIAIRLGRLLDVRTRGEGTRGALLRLDHAVTSVVRELQQVTVGVLKAGTAGQKLGARIPGMLQRTAHARVNQYLGARAMAALAAALSLDAAAFDHVIATRIEAAVYKLRHQRQRRAPCGTTTVRAAG